jgi:phosphopantetheinyl transferase
VEQLPLTDRKFFEIWTKKEAYTKYLGTGLTIDITTINMLSKEHSDKLYSFGSEDYIFSIYCDDNKKVSPVCISEDELINSIKK